MFLNKNTFTIMYILDIKQILDNEFIYEKYEDFMVRRVLAADPDTRWCPAPDCKYVVFDYH